MHRKGVHCGSTAMGDALRARGLELPEARIFGLGAGPGFAIHSGDTQLTPPQASRFFVGRSPSFERDLCEAIGARLEEEQFEDAESAWPRIEELARAGELPLVYADLFHLPYVGAHGHWFGHLVAVAGVRGGTALIADNEYAELQPCPVENLKKALGSYLPVPQGTECTVLRVTSAPREVPKGATRRAILLDALHMTEDAAPGTGVLGLHALPDEMGSWADRSDPHRCARLCAQAIEVRGCGGGLFRRLYGSFLEGEGLPELAQLSAGAADSWTALAQAFQQRDLAAAAERARQCAAAEEALWTRAREQCE